MRSNAFFTFVLLPTAASSTIAAPAPEPIFDERSYEFSDIEARAGFGSLLGAAGKGLLTGAGLAGLTTFLQNELGGDSQKRELSEDQLARFRALLAADQRLVAADRKNLAIAGRANLGPLLASAGKGLLTGAGLAGLTTFLQNEFGGGSQKRELTDNQMAMLQILAGPANEHQARGLGSLFVKGGEDIASILGKGIAGGAGSGVGASIINGIFGGSDQQKRELYERGLGSLFVKGGEDIASILGKGIAGGVGSGVGASIINGIFGCGDDNKRAVNPIAIALSQFPNNVPNIPLSELALDPEKREPVNPLLGLLIGQGASFGTSQLVQEGIDKVEGLFKGGKREPVNPLLGLLVGQGASFGMSQLVQEGVDKAEGLFKGGKRELSFNDLD